MRLEDYKDGLDSCPLLPQVSLTMKFKGEAPKGVSDPQTHMVQEERGSILRKRHVLGNCHPLWWASWISLL